MLDGVNNNQFSAPSFYQFFNHKEYRIMQDMHINDTAIQNMLEDNAVEADVWFVGISATTNEVFTQPWWECNTAPEDLAAHAIRCAIKWNEVVGAGEVRVKWFDLRSDFVKTKIVEAQRAVTEDWPPVAVAA